MAKGEACVQACYAEIENERYGRFALVLSKEPAARLPYLVLTHERVCFRATRKSPSPPSRAHPSDGNHGRNIDTSAFRDRGPSGGESSREDHEHAPESPSHSCQAHRSL